MTADVTLAEFPGRRFQGILVRTAEDINLATRRRYREMHLGIRTGQQSARWIIHVNLYQQCTRVGVVKEGKVVLTIVTPGHDFGNEIEIVSGLKADDQIIINPPDSLVAGQEVQRVQATLPGDIK